MERSWLWSMYSMSSVTSWVWQRQSFNCLCLTKHHTMESRGIAPRNLNLNPRWRRWSDSRLGSFTPGENASDAIRIVGWVSTRAGWTRWKKKILLWSYRESNPSRQARGLVTILTELSRLLQSKWLQDRAAKVLLHLFNNLHLSSGDMGLGLRYPTIIPIKGKVVPVLLFP
jgi:hypothetical protein